MFGGGVWGGVLGGFWGLGLEVRGGSLDTGSGGCRGGGACLAPLSVRSPGLGRMRQASVGRRGSFQVSGVWGFSD